ncbi:substrate-binding and VWA domain-containing protein [Nonomuraea endophytica]|uniref:Ca-activated chloride channel family protein n=1 Tax=Nonomuraea endophytica TaxID=714136 RepID=A0A7W8ECR4_9ACTN|nr:substrate-binding and VWA domain-containing protein [Nonomuraea endophytica]MBB5074618.1 Ca-activated chloride channel family protein [Nonomuraea endophytica]
MTILAGGLVVALRVIFVGAGTDAAPRPARQYSCEDGGAKLRVLASPEKSELLRKMAAAYNGRKTSGAPCADVIVVTKASGAALTALATTWDKRLDGPRPDVWSPAGSSWLTLLRQRAAAAGKPSPVAEDNPSIARTPLVIAMPRPMAEALGWPAKALGWSDVLELSGQGWAKYGHPEWGSFRLGKTNPNFSTSGLNATVGAYFAATGLSGDLTGKNVADAATRRFVQATERSIVHYGDTTLTFLSNLRRADDAGAGLTYISAVTVEEKSVWDYNQGNPTGDPKTLGKHAKPKVPLVAIYPKEGTLYSDNPFALLNPAKAQAAADFVKYLQAPEQQARFAEYAFRRHDGTPGKLITEANGLLPGQPAKELKPPAPDVLDKVLQSWTELRKPANVLLVIDTSGSMGAPAPKTGKSKLELARQAAVKTLPQFGPADRVGLWMFSLRRDGDKDHLRLAEIAPMTPGHRDEIRRRIEGLTPEGGTGLYDTALAAHRRVSDTQSQDAINAVVFLTDGQNEDKRSISLKNLLSQLRTEQGAETVRLFTIAYGKDADLGVLKKISEATNAAAYDSRKPGSIDQVFTAVVSNF